MANYIDKRSILCEAYVHIKTSLDDFTPQEQKAIINKLKTNSQEIADFFLNQENEVDVVTEDGSIKSYITVLGTVASLYASSPSQTSFASNTKNLYKDSKRISNYLSTTSMLNYQARDSDIEYSEARCGVIGSIYKIVRKMERAQDFNGHSHDLVELNDEMLSCSKDIDQLNTNLKGQKDKTFVKKHLTEMIKAIPKTPRHKEMKSHPKNLIADYQKAKQTMEDSLNKWDAKLP